jgi:membrane protein implicated in regulation of membrane protease activity
MTHWDPDLGPVHSALTLRLWLAGFGLVFCAVAGGIVAATGPLWLAVVLLVLAVVALVDIVVVARRKRRGEPG